MAGMTKWPTSKSAQAGLSLASAIFLGYLAYKIASMISLEHLVKEYPHDGQVGLGAMMQGLEAGALVFCLAFPVLFGIQRWFMGRN